MTGGRGKRFIGIFRAAADMSDRWVTGIQMGSESYSCVRLSDATVAICHEPALKHLHFKALTEHYKADGMVCREGRVVQCQYAD